VGRHPRPVGDRAGVCRFCRCTHFNPCPEGCWWADRAQTLCSGCADVDAAWRRVRLQKLPNMRRAFARGFEAARWATEPARPKNPYRPGRTALYWQLGFTAGEKACALLTDGTWIELGHLLRSPQRGQTVRVFRSPRVADRARRRWGRGRWTAMAIVPVGGCW